MNNRFREAWTPIYAGLQQSNHLRNEFFPPILARKMSYDCISIDTGMKYIFIFYVLLPTYCYQ